MLIELLLPVDMLAAGEPGRYQYIHVTLIRGGRQFYVLRGKYRGLGAGIARLTPLAARDGMSSEGAGRQVCAQGVRQLVDQVFTDLCCQHGAHGGGHLFA